MGIYRRGGCYRILTAFTAVRLRLLNTYYYIAPTRPSEAAQTSRTWTCLPPSGINSDIFSWVCWNLWTTRNKLLFESRPTSAQATTTKSLVNAREWLQAQDPTKSPQKNTQIQARPPSIPVGTVTCYTDAAWKKESLTAGLAWIFDSASSLTRSDGCQYQTWVSSALMAEGLAIRATPRHHQNLDPFRLSFAHQSHKLG
ncbi:PREDICTED: uncharacterized protein LOC106303420 [Brassica oleracea var. oleracea]|uniref:uncharacterized protein LOC106303420 n=1 Tax=Brassica oleracea var. oleracea TaxID=109376 RepID=UPI0006A7134E|nr:PREDICTED: uncharacterized protein LOC106303420 [Brassica oleracea var. oleracea]